MPKTLAPRELEWLLDGKIKDRTDMAPTLRDAAEWPAPRFAAPAHSTLAQLLATLTVWVQVSPLDAVVGRVVLPNPTLEDQVHVLCFLVPCENAH